MFLFSSTFNSSDAAAPRAPTSGPKFFLEIHRYQNNSRELPVRAPAATKAACDKNDALRRAEQEPLVEPSKKRQRADRGDKLQWTHSRRPSIES